MIQTLFGSLKQDDEPEKKSIFDRMKQAVSRTRESLEERIEGVIALTREVDESTLDDLEMSLIASDLGVSTTEEILNTLRDHAKRKGIRDGEELRSLLKMEIKTILDEQERPVRAVTGPEVILMVGVNGTGKTTTSGKLAALYRAEGKTVLLCAADTFRAAAIEQLEVWSQRSGVELIKSKQGGDPSAVLYDALDAAKKRNFDVVI